LMRITSIRLRWRWYSWSSPSPSSNINTSVRIWDELMRVNSREAFNLSLHLLLAYEPPPSHSSLWWGYCHTRFSKEQN
jgi:hypothetical protein